MRSDNQNFADDKGNADAKTMNSINSIATNQKNGIYETNLPSEKPSGNSSGNRTYTKFSSELAWETEVWISDLSEYMIHLNGDRFMEPR